MVSPSVLRFDGMQWAIMRLLETTKNPLTWGSSGFRDFMTLHEMIIWWPGTGSNRRHADFQSAALPTELPGRHSTEYMNQCAAKARLYADFWLLG